MNPEKAPLMCRVVQARDGQPLKSVLARKFPMLTRQERRMLLKIAKRELKKQAKLAAKQAEKAVVA
jgi:hypothetical protein